MASPLTKEWKRKRENFVKYVINIDNFEEKMMTYNSGEKIHSSIIKLNDS